MLICYGNYSEGRRYSGTTRIGKRGKEAEIDVVGNGVKMRGGLVMQYEICGGRVTGL